MRVGVVGATGMVGTMLLRTLEERAFPVEELRVFASPRSAGKAVPFKGVEVIVEDSSSADYSGLDVVLASFGATPSRELLPRIADQGVISVDNSSAWRMDPDVPLVVPEVNAHALADIRKGIVANPNCTTMVCMPVLQPLHAAAGLRRITAATYQAVSGGGVEGVAELADQVAEAGEKARELSWSGEAVALGEPRKYTGPIAFNVLADAGFGADPFEETGEELKFRNESRKILSIPTLDVCCTCVRVPVFTGHSVSMVAEFERDLSPEDAVALLQDAAGVRYVEVPSPLQAAGIDPSLVGRIRRAGDTPNALALFVSGDNLRKGAALNTVQIAEALADQGRIG